MKLEFGYGKQTQFIELPEKNLAATLMSNSIRHERCDEDAVRWALAHPVDSLPLSKLANRNQKVVIVTSDITRPLPSYVILPPLLDELYEAGCPRENITVVLALGSHRAHTEEEKRRLVGDRAYSEVNVVDSNINDTVHLGYTAAGTPVDYDRIVAEADLRICLGNIEFHYFAGYSGGYKAIMPGVSTPHAIQTNHRMMIQDGACAGNLETNPVRQDLEEAGAMLGVDFIVNVVLDEHKRIVYAVAGDVVSAHRDGCRYIDRMYRKPIQQRADIVIVSQGGYPKDSNMYQTQKALDNAKHAVKPGGTIILIGACTEGFGNATFRKWMTEATSPDELVTRISQDFKLGGHKAAAIALVLQKASIYLVSELKDSEVEDMFMIPAESAQAAFDEVFAKYGPDATIIAMPYGGSVLPEPAE